MATPDDRSDESSQTKNDSSNSQRKGAKYGLIIASGLALIGLIGSSLLVSQKSQTGKSIQQRYSRSLQLQHHYANVPNPLLKVKNTSSSSSTCNKNKQQSLLQGSNRDWQVNGIVNGCGSLSRTGYSLDLTRTGKGPTRMIVGSPYHPTKKEEQGPGFVEAFEYDEKKGVWKSLGREYGKNVQDGMGFSVGITSDGNKAISGAPFAKKAKGTIHVMGGDCKNEEWTQSSKTEGSNFGYAVAADDKGNRFIAGGPALYGDSRIGFAKVLDSKGNMLGQRLQSSTSGDGFGMAVSISGDGNFVAVGAPLIDPRVQVYKWNGSKYKKFGKAIKPTTDSNKDGDFDFSKADISQFGYSVSLSGDGKTVAVGAPSQSGSPDFVRVFTWHKDEWRRHGAILSGALYSFGYTVSLSRDGSWLSVGDPSYDEEGQQARGRVCVFNYSSGKDKWIKQGNDVIGSGPFDNAGVATAIAKDKCGDVVVGVGCPFSEPDGMQSGMVAVMQFN